MKFEFRGWDHIGDHIKGEHMETTKSFEAETWPEVVERFEEFLRGCGFVFEGSLEMVEPVRACREWK